ncbi:hypothetical protein GF362_04830, partial [Candidatus Dojkabacteria bacterium]|nr:hypothetical protein [Candidatus Dojkabacteria bacterium]
MVGMSQDENSGGNIKHVKPLSPLERIGLGKEKQYFMENLAMLFATDMDIVYAFEAIKTGMKSKPMRRLMEGVIYEIKSGSPIWKTLEKTGLFKDSTISLIKIGEQTGKLPENLKVVVDQQEKQRIFGSKIRSAMMYPLLIMSVMIVVGTGVSWFILPKLGMVFESLNLELPLPTRILLAVGQFLSDYGFIAVPVFFTLLIFLFYIIFVNKKTKHIGQAILIRIPVLKKLILAVELARFAYVFSTLLSSGISILLALDTLAESATFPRFRKLYEAMRIGIENGKSFGTIFQEYKHSKKAIPSHIQHMIA